MIPFIIYIILLYWVKIKLLTKSIMNIIKKLVYKINIVLKFKLIILFFNSFDMIYNLIFYS